MDYKKIWEKTDEDLKSSLPAHAYEAWIETLSPIGITNDIFIVEAPNQFAYDWIINNYQDIILSSLKEVDSTLQLKVSICLLYTSPSPRDKRQSRMPSSA